MWGGGGGQRCRHYLVKEQYLFHPPNIYLQGSEKGHCKNRELCVQNTCSCTRPVHIICTYEYMHAQLNTCTCAYNVMHISYKYICVAQYLCILHVHFALQALPVKIQLLLQRGPLCTHLQQPSHSSLLPSLHP